MKPTTKKWTTVSLAGLMAVAAVGCGNKSNEADLHSVGGEAGQAKSTLKSLQIWMKDDYNTYPVAKVLEEKTGYKVQYDMLPQDKPEDKLNLILSSGEAYDAITTLGSVDMKALYSDYAKRGALLDLGPLLDKYGPNIKASLSPETLESAKIDGKLYGIPTSATESAAASLMIRQDWLDKLGLKVPTTTDELVAVLKAFKEKDPGGNGDKNVPFAIKSDAPFVENIAGAFGLANNWNALDGKLAPRVLDPAYKDYVTYMNGLYKDGLLDKEFAINKDANVKEKFSSGKAGVIPMSWSDVPSLTDALKKNQPDAKWTYLPALKGPGGKSGLGIASGWDRITYIPKSSKHPEEAIKWMNAKLEKDTFKLMTIGEEGKHHTFKDGAYTPILPIFADERNQANNFLMGADEKNYPTYWQARVRKDMRLFEAWDYLNNKLPAQVRFSDPLGKSPFLPEFSRNNGSLTAMMNEQTIKYVMGVDGFASYDAFVQKYKAAGGEASVKEVNDWYGKTKK